METVYSKNAKEKTESVKSSRMIFHRDKLTEQ